MVPAADMCSLQPAACSTAALATPSGCDAKWSCSQGHHYSWSHNLDISIIHSVCWNVITRVWFLIASNKPVQVVLSSSVALCSAAVLQIRQTSPTTTQKYCGLIRDLLLVTAPQLAQLFCHALLQSAAFCAYVR